jgi:hypothetical protein
MNRRYLALLFVAIVLGCSNTQNPTSNNVLFQQIEGAVEDIKMNVSSKYYSGDLGDDRLGMALATFEKSVAGTALEPEVKKLSSKVTEVSTLASKRPKIDKLRAAVQELSDAVAEFKKKL